MRNDTEVKQKLIDVLDVSPEQRTEILQALEKLDTNVLSVKLIEHHSTRGMAAALFWVLGYKFKDIVDMFVDPHQGEA